MNSPRKPSPEGYQVGPETFVTLQCQVFDAEGELASEPETLATVFGLGQLLPKVEKELEGHFEGETIEVVLRTEDAYGKRDPQAVLEVDRSEFPDAVAAGDRFEVENEQGGLLVVHVLEVLEQVVVLDTNHPLADQEVKFQVKIQEVRPASEDEMEAAVALMEEDSDYLKADTPNVSVNSLMNRPA